MKPYFPLFVDMSNKKALIVGGGSIGTRRALALLPFCGSVYVMDEHPSHELLRKSHETDSLALIQEAWRLTTAPERRVVEKVDELKTETVNSLYVDPRIMDVDLVLACTDDAEVNEDIHNACASRNIPVNICNDREKCDFYFPGLAMQDDVVVGITASGQNHGKVRKLRQAIEKILHANRNGSC